MEAESERKAAAAEEEPKEVAKDFFHSESDVTMGSVTDATTTNPDVVDPDVDDDAQSDLNVHQEEPVKEERPDDVPRSPPVKVADGSVDVDDGKDGTVDVDNGKGEDATTEKKVDWPEKAAALKNFVKERGIVVSKALRRLSGKREDFDQPAEDGESGKPDSASEKIWSSLSFIKSAPAAETPAAGPEFRGRVTLFSRSGCADSRAARLLLREKQLPFVEINLDIFPERGLELEERSGASSVPQVFFNEQLIGGIDELNALVSSGELEEKIKMVVENECPNSAPRFPLYGEDESENTNPNTDEFAEVVQKLREKVQVKDRFLKLRLFTKSFSGSDAVDFISEDQYCERDEAVEFGRKVAKKHFFHHVLNENVFEDGGHLYRFFEHDPAVFRCLNFSGAVNLSEPKPAAEVGEKLRKLILAIYERYVSDDGKHVNYYAISVSEEFRRYVKLTEELHRIDVLTLSREEKLSFFLNIYNAMAIHAIIQYGRPDGPLERRRFFGDVQYVIGGYAYSLSAIENGVLRANQRPPYEFTKPFSAKDPRLQVALKDPEPLVHFGLCFGTASSPALRCYTPEGVDAELRIAAREFFETGAKVETEVRMVTLSKTMKWYSVDFGKNEREVLHWIAKHVDPTKAEHILSLLDETSQVKVNYMPHEWKINM